MGAIVVLLICSGHLERSECTEKTARVAISTRIEQIGCGVGVLAAPAKMALGGDEFARVRCIMK